MRDQVTTPERVSGGRDAVAEAPAFELAGITGGYGTTTVVRDVSVTMGGGIHALLGANGAGKTTLLRMAAGLTPNRSGTVRVMGRDVSRMAPHARARAGLCLIPEGRGIFRQLSVRENLALQTPPWKKEGGYDQAVEAFPVLGNRLSQIAGTLSGGEQQMLAMARCYLGAPRVALLDEVSMGLAPRIVDEIFESLTSLASLGVALFVVEQYVQRALELAQIVHVLKAGEIVLTAPAAELTEDDVVSRYLQ